MKVSARSAGGQVCILHLARFNDFPGAKIVAIEPVQKTKPREKMVYFSLTAKFEWLTLVRPAATARAHSRSRNAFGEETLTSCLTRVGGPEIGRGVRQRCCSRQRRGRPHGLGHRHGVPCDLHFDFGFHVAGHEKMSAVGRECRGSRLVVLGVVFGRERRRGIPCGTLGGVASHYGGERLCLISRSRKSSPFSACVPPPIRRVFWGTSF